MKIEVNKTGLAVGSLFGLMHFAWIGSVWAFKDDAFNFLSSIHFLNITGSVTNVELGTAIIGIVLAFVTGYVAGIVFAWVWNKLT